MQHRFWFCLSAAAVLCASACTDSKKPGGSDTTSGSGGSGGSGGTGGSGGNVGSGGVDAVGGSGGIDAVGGSAGEAAGGQAGDGAGGDSGSPAFRSGCDEPGGDPTIHDDGVTSDETWTAADSPHHVTADVYVNAGTTLTIDPCAVVLIDDDVQIVVDDTMDGSGSLVAEGQPGEEILFSGLDGATWRNLRVVYPGTASLAHARFEQGGSDDLTYDGATLVVLGDDELPVKRSVTLDTVEIRESAGYGLLVDLAGGFSADSSGLTISGSGQSSDDHGAPIYVGVPSVGTLPGGSYAANDRDVILVDPTDGIEDDTEMRPLGVPFEIEGDLTVAEGTRSTDGVPTLTVAAGTELRFATESYLRLGLNTAGGALAANGTAAEPVVFTSAAVDPAAGDWVGIWFDGDPAPAENSVEHARVEYAGGVALTLGGSCLPSTDSDEAAAFIVGYEADSAFISDTEVVESAGHGVVRSYAADPIGPDYTDSDLNNSFDVAGCEQTNPKDTSNTCDNRDSCG